MGDANLLSGFEMEMAVATEENCTCLDTKAASLHCVGVLVPCMHSGRCL